MHHAPQLATPTARRSRSVSRAILAATLALASAACASTSARPMLSKEAKMLDLPLVEQDEMYACGLVSITALCRYWNVTIPPAESGRLAEVARANEGLSGGELREALSDLGFDTFLFRGELDHGTTGLFAHVDASRPPLVMVSPDPDSRHYVLFIGYDEPQRMACLLDPVRGRVLVPYETFEESWRACNRFTLLAVPSALPNAPTLATEASLKKKDRP
jgi:ABC-type bacteriocin/lantibiotic exporter with double-glycine peptidase domain